ncbi:interleukin-1 receptor-associated kinase-like 2 [Protopterus annectens]|uniref:interleukin-1 receptor-associated kinase-like 2 n=1 Tax=Protopterus annectens TaxID=7888 RepID=UPI001CF95EB2|nr:interleukin-1 receptor-associated kinase-like 2 [Protopterus annectens]
MAEETSGTESRYNCRSACIYDLPSTVLHTVCNEIDSLSDRDWMRFASRIVTDQTELRVMRLAEKSGRSRTEELMWWWSMRLGTVQELLELLNEMEFYRTARFLSDWNSSSYVTHPSGAPLEQTKQQCPDDCQKKLNDADLAPDATGITPSTSGGPVQLPCPPAPPTEFLHSVYSLHDENSLCKPQQETNGWSHIIVWTMEHLKEATNNFSNECKISEGRFGDTFVGERLNTLYVIKRLKENNDFGQRIAQKSYDTELRICAQCHHHNILQVLGCYAEHGFYILIYPHMPNGSLEDRLQCLNGSVPLCWEKRISISTGLTTAIQFLHARRIIHGNVKSSNVLLDKNCVAKLAHARVQFESKTEFTHMKTITLQGYLTYLPEDILRHGQITEKVDIFACGIVLAEVLTGMKAMDTTRVPMYLKDLFLHEIGRAKEACSMTKSVEELAAQELCSKYLDRKAGCLPSSTALHFATAVCTCLRKKSPLLSEIQKKIETLKSQANCNFWKMKAPPPEETEDTTVNCSEKAHTRKATDADCLWASNVPAVSSLWSDRNRNEIPRIPCESDESEDFVYSTSHTATSNVQYRKFNMDNLEKALLVSTGSLDYSKDCFVTSRQEPVETSSSWTGYLSSDSSIPFGSCRNSQKSSTKRNESALLHISPEPIESSEKKLEQNAANFKCPLKEPQWVPQEQLVIINNSCPRARNNNDMQMPGTVQVSQDFLSAPGSMNGLSCSRDQTEITVQGDAALTHPTGIEINAAKRDLMEKIDLYNKNEIDSGLLFES